ncbi:AraC family transcriptional regulator [Thalassococcus sp. S3]|uniref:helix-turn-helix domain-containing protein n=1 Tax=Thalassococcus sp. S3 TaxID=2017482 RepID=UPI0013EEC7FB|nr:helix-turn-helix transcriptional regulator [Thalassococcus sp. S3]
MEDVQHVDVVFAAVKLGLCGLAAYALFWRSEQMSVNLPLSLFFLAQSVACLHLIFATPLVIPTSFPLHLLFALSLPASLVMKPLLWVYVRRLTCEDADRPGWPLLHALPALAGLAIGLAFLSLPGHMRTGLFEDVLPDAVLASGTALFVGYAMLLISLVFLAQVAVYIALILGRLARYRARLKDLFASTEDREMRWISTLAISAIGFWGISTVFMALDIFTLPSDVMSVVNNVAALVVLSVIAVWGLRQKPGFLRMPSAASETTTQIKYERSALSADQSNRIARKIDLAMQRDALYRDPNLSLWDLAKHVGVTSNYLSQTLNETIGETFFDYVNKWRIREAVRLIQSSDETILVISYDVGFNSRSSFYKAFKRETGMTPTALKRQVEEAATVADTAG